jgi:hypothetical protein
MAGGGNFASAWKITCYHNLTLLEKLKRIRSLVNMRSGHRHADGVSEFKLLEKLAKKLKGTLTTIEDLEAELRK